MKWPREMGEAFHQTLAFMAFLLLILLPIPAYSQIRRMCLTQVSLANQACSLLPLERPRDPIEELSEHHHGEQRHGHQHQHHNHQNKSRHKEHHQHHEHVKHHVGGPLREECCRWLKELDSACVCETLVRLPRFLLRPMHKYTVAVKDLCEVTYECSAV